MRPLNPEEEALWERVIASVRPLHPQPRRQKAEQARPTESKHLKPVGAKPVKAPPFARTQVGTTLDASWDRRLARGLVQPDLHVDLHGHGLASAYDLLDASLERGIASGARLLLLITGKPPSGKPPIARGKIRGAVGDWLAASRHAADIAAVRGAHARHGGSGALYIVLRRRR